MAGLSLPPGLDRTAPVLIAGPTASGKSALALAIAERLGGRIVNADALQVYADWRVLTARPGRVATAAVPHALYGHVDGAAPYSVGAWLRDVAPLLAGPRPILVGGTGLYFAALTEGLAEIPPTPAAVRDTATARLAAEGPAGLLAEIDAATAGGIDQQNPARVQRAWEVQAATGRGLADWQADTGPPLLPAAVAHRLVLGPEPRWLAARIADRTERMLAEGALEEARANAPGWRPDRPSAKAIGAAELVAHVRGEMSLDAARARIETLTRQYAKRQRTWFRGRMGNWRWIDPAA